MTFDYLLYIQDEEDNGQQSLQLMKLKEEEKFPIKKMFGIPSFANRMISDHLIPIE